MAFLIQHGYGKADRLTTIPENAPVTGVILSAGDEETPALQTTAATVEDGVGEVLVDPQTYIYSTSPMGTARFHKEKGLEVALAWSKPSMDYSALMNQVRNLNERCGSAQYIAPGPALSSFLDVWTPLALQMARLAANEWGANTTIATLCIEESAFSDKSALESFLDEITTLDVAGFYILVDRHPTSYPPDPWTPEKLANYLTLVYRLSVLNEYRVICGYTDFVGIVARAAGASDFASGWSYGLRNFTTDKWKPRKGGGRPANPRLTVSDLWSPLLNQGEVNIIDAADQFRPLIERDVANSPYISDLRDLSRREATTQYLEALARLDSEINTPSTTVTERLGDVRRRIDYAVASLNKLRKHGIQVDPPHTARLLGLGSGIDQFIQQERL